MSDVKQLFAGIGCREGKPVVLGDGKEAKGRSLKTLAHHDTFNASGTYRRT